MLADDILDGFVCSICYSDFKDTGGARIGHGEAVVCHDCCSKLPAEAKVTLKKAFYYTQGYLFNITVPYAKRMMSLIIKPLHNIDQILYEVYDEQLIGVVGINEKANWDADREMDRHLVYEIGKAIEKKERE